MESALIVSCSDKGTAFFTELLGAASVPRIVTLRSCGEARRHLLDHSFDLIIVNAPLGDETGEAFARCSAAKGASQVILVVNSELFDAVSAVCEGDGVLTVAKPVSRAVFWSALTLAKSVHSRLRRIEAENTELKRKIEDIRIVSRAKLILISSMNLSEEEAHRLIEKQAMNRRVTRRAVAEGILTTYGN